MHGGGGFFFFFNDTATTEIYTLSLPRRSSDLSGGAVRLCQGDHCLPPQREHGTREPRAQRFHGGASTQHAERRSEEHTSELQSQSNLVCRLLLEKKKKTRHRTAPHTPRINTHP